MWVLIPHLKCQLAVKAPTVLHHLVVQAISEPDLMLVVPMLLFFLCVYVFYVCVLVVKFCK